VPSNTSVLHWTMWSLWQHCNDFGGKPPRRSFCRQVPCSMPTNQAHASSTASSAADPVVCCCVAVAGSELLTAASLSRAAGHVCFVSVSAVPHTWPSEQGEHAHRIWSAIYNQSCFTDGVSCSEERVFYRLISGMHASISCHLSSDYLLDEQKGIWGPNMTELKQRLGTPETRCVV
jgi:hypothetical protein